MKSIKRLVAVLILVSTPAVIAQITTLDLTALTASAISDPTTVFIPVDVTAGPVSRKLSIAELKQTDDVRKVATVAAMQALTDAKDNQRFMTDGYSVEGVGANLYRYDAASAATADGGFVITATGMGAGRFIAVDQTVADVTKFGAVGDDSTDSTAAIQAAIDAAFAADVSVYGMASVFIPKGIYRVTDELELRYRMAIRGESRSLSVLRFVPATDAEGLACIAAKGGPTVNDYIWFPEISDLTILLTSSGHTANERYGIYLQYPTRARVENVEIDVPSGVTGKDWVGLRTGREQGRYRNISIHNFPVGLWVDNSDNNTFTDFSYLDLVSTPNALPHTAVYTPPEWAQSNNIFDGNHMVAGFEHAFYYRYTGTIAHGVKLSGWRTEQVIEPQLKEFTVDTGADTINCVGHGYRNGDFVTFFNSGGALPAPIATNTHRPMYVRNATADTFQISYDETGGVNDITSAGTGTHTVRKEVYRFDFGGSGFILNLKLDYCSVGDSGFANLLYTHPNINSVDVSNWRVDCHADARTKAFYVNGLSPSNRCRFRATNGVIPGNTAKAVLRSFSTAPDVITLSANAAAGNVEDSRDWVIQWFNNSSSYVIFNSFNVYRTNNTSARDINLSTTSIKPGHVITLDLDSNSTLKNSATQILAKGADFTPVSGRAVVQLRFDGTNWIEVAPTSAWP